jgi:hypothetical protein
LSWSAVPVSVLTLTEAPQLTARLTAAPRPAAYWVSIENVVFGASEASGNLPVR